MMNVFWKRRNAPQGLGVNDSIVETISIVALWFESLRALETTHLFQLYFRQHKLALTQGQGSSIYEE